MTLPVSENAIRFRDLQVIVWWTDHRRCARGAALSRCRIDNGALHRLTALPPPAPEQRVEQRRVQWRSVQIARRAAELRMHPHNSNAQGRAGAAGSEAAARPDAVALPDTGTAQSTSARHGEASLADRALGEAGGEGLRRGVGRAMRRLGPFLILLYVVSFLDRANIGFAKQALATSEGINERMYALAAGLFFISYSLCGFPEQPYSAQDRGAGVDGVPAGDVGAGVDGHHVRDRRGFVFIRCGCCWG